MDTLEVLTKSAERAMTDRRSTCHHEAAHAVTAAAFGIRPQSVSVLGDPKARGAVYVRGGALAAMTPRDRAIMALAGPLAQHKYIVSQGKAGRFIGSLADGGPVVAGIDRELVEGSLDVLAVAGDRGGWRRTLERATAMMLNDPATWSEITELADALFTTGGLTGVQLDNLGFCRLPWEKKAAPLPTATPKAVAPKASLSLYRPAVCTDGIDYRDLAAASASLGDLPTDHPATVIRALQIAGERKHGPLPAAAATGAVGAIGGISPRARRWWQQQQGTRR